MGRKYKVRQTGMYFGVRAASTANVATATLDAGQTLDGVTLAEGDWVLLKNQTTASQNGVYKIGADTVAAARPTSADAAKREYGVGFDAAGTVVVVSEGTANGGKSFLCYTEPGVVDTNDLVYIETVHPTKK